MAYLDHPLADTQQLNIYESISLWETPSCGSSSQTFLSQEMDRREKQKQLMGRFSNTRGCCRVSSRQDRDPTSFVLAHPWSRVAILAEHPWKQSVHCLLPVPLSIKRGDVVLKFTPSAWMVPRGRQMTVCLYADSTLQSLSSIILPQESPPCCGRQLVSHTSCKSSFAGQQSWNLHS